MLKPSFPLGLLRDVKRFGGVRQELVAPLVILGLADLVIPTDTRDRFTLEFFKYDDGLGLGIPLPSFHG